MAKMGRPTKLTPEIRNKVRKLAPLALTDKQLAAAIDVSEKTLNTWKQDEDFLQSLNADKADADELVKQSLYSQAMIGNVTAQIFWLKNRDPQRWREKHEVQVNGDINTKVEIAFTSDDEASKSSG